MKQTLVYVLLVLLITTLLSCRGGISGSKGDASCTPIADGASTIRLAAVGDTGRGNADQLAVADLIARDDAEDDFDAMTILGDMIYSEGDPALIDAYILIPYADTLDGATSLIPILGNHDIGLGMQDQIMDELGAPGRWYSRTLGTVLFIVLDSNQSSNATQLAWLEAELEAADARWIVVGMHHPMYSAGTHGSSIGVRNNFKELFETYGVDLVLAGHDHDYQRQEVMNDIMYIVSGAGSSLRAAGTESFTVVSESVLHYVELDFTDEVMEATAHGVAGTVDSFSICHADSNMN